MDNPMRIVLTGGPGGGKSTAADMIGREFGDRVAVLQETATMLFRGGFPRDGVPAARRACQRAIYKTQIELEEAVAAHCPGRYLFCDRGTLDGAAYWPDGIESFLRELNTSVEREYERYHAVIFFESAASGGAEPDRSTNPYRIETTTEAAQIDARLREIWSGHPRFFVIKSNRSFFAKVAEAIHFVSERLAEPSKTWRFESRKV